MSEDQGDREGLGACQASPATACSPSGSSPVPGLAADALRPTGAGFIPGPWFVDVTPNPNISGAHWREVRLGEHGPVLAEVFHDLGDADPCFSDEDAEANARLISAAPDLYEALSAAVEVHGDGYSWGPAARAALRKARGDQ